MTAIVGGCLVAAGYIVGFAVCALSMRNERDDHAVRCPGPQRLDGDKILIPLGCCAKDFAIEAAKPDGFIDARQTHDVALQSMQAGEPIK